MGQTISQKIIAAHAGRDSVSPGEFVTVRYDWLMLNDGSGPPTILKLRELENGRVAAPERVVLVPDHNVPAKDIRSATHLKLLADFARTEGIHHYYGLGVGGIAHLVMAERGLVRPGDLIVGGDSHTCLLGALGAFATGMGITDLTFALATGTTWLMVPETIEIVYHGHPGPWISGKDLVLRAIGELGTDGALYQTIEFSGPVIRDLSVSQRITMCNMGVEMGAKTALVTPDEETSAFLAAAVADNGPTDFRTPTPVHADEDAAYAQRYEIDITGLTCQVACPPSPANVRAAEELEDTRIDQVWVGSCANAKLDDLRVIAQLLSGRRVHPDVRLVIAPGTQRVMRAALAEDLIDVFVEAGAVIGPPTCGACFGGHMGLLAAGERALTTTNRNFPGRMGSPEAEIYLAGPAVAAATAVCGHIADPRRLARELSK